MKPLKSICDSSFGLSRSNRCHFCAASLAASVIRPFRFRIAPIVLAAGGRSPFRSSTRRILRAFQYGCASRSSRILSTIATSVAFGECLGLLDRSSYVSVSSEPRSIHLYAVVAEIPYRRHNSRMFAPACLANVTNSRRADMIDTSLHPIAASQTQAAPVRRMCPPCPRPPVHHVPGTYTRGPGRRRAPVVPLRDRDGRIDVARPALHAADHVLYARPAVLQQVLLHVRAAAAAAADHHHVFILRDLVQAPLHLIHRDVDRRRDVSGGPFVWLADVDQNQVIDF